MPNLLTISSVISVLFFTFHLAHDIVRGIEKGGVSNLTAIPLFTIWLYGSVVLVERRSGYIIKLLGALLALAVPILHMRGKGVGGEFAKSSGAFFFIWTLIVLGVTGLFSFVLSVQGLWRLRRSARHKPGE